MSPITVRNPIIWADVPDISVIRVEDTYYMVSTSMHSMPGCPILKSNNLRDWELHSYVYETLEANDAHELKGGSHIYGKGMWAASLRYHNHMFYVCFSANDTKQFYIYTTDDIESGNWDRHVIDGLRHDPSLFFDEEHTYVIHGNGRIMITELTADATALKPNGINQLLLETEKEGMGLRAEGCHAYKMNGYYYLFFIEWPSVGNKRRREVCYRSESLFGPYESRIVLDDDMNFYNNGVAQGGIVDTPEREWYAVLFQDRGAVGRVPILVPMHWSDDWPVLGIDGKVPEEFEAKLPEGEKKPLTISDDFQSAEQHLPLQWQWNHNPDHELWSLTKNKGYLTLEAGHVTKSVEFARNTLTQRTEGPWCSASTSLDISEMIPGNRAGLVALQHDFGAVGVEISSNGKAFITLYIRGEDGSDKCIESIPYDGNTIVLKADFNFHQLQDTVDFYYSSEGNEWNKIGERLQLKYTLTHFMGVRIGLYHFATEQIGGVAKFEYFQYDTSETAADSINEK
ncbi:glycoside hydrolase family 43 protein [Alkalicoccobacillus porphyridii]|uniref:Glycosyl hydrolase 43 family protein n=1 Tax=Alkalicoccobacillus porphyridii TaxID=2597270 RepID=A0A554A2E3_9BACI|nr:glycoside hydrolase 43 family protein [Alkalicoccobacillus porphyridii]TSB47860.1 glycosyl hydrolase 43 family protein [Alkalicoccobacillus porphyridii]